MQKFYKQRIYKKYNDEIWGSLITSRKFSYNKRSILLNYKDISIRSRFNFRTKYKYFRKGFLKRLKYTLFNFKFFRRVFRLTNFSSRMAWLNTTSMISPVLLVPDYAARRKKRWYFRKVGAKFFYFKRKKSISTLKFTLISLCSLSCNKNRRVLNASNQILKFGDFSFLHFKFLSVFPRRHLVWRNFVKFAHLNNLRYVIRRKLNLRREKVFFYSVHVASPRKKRKKWSLFGLKNIYYKKVSLFFGFKKVADFLKLYNSFKKIWGANQSSFFLALECRLDNLLYRLNFFDSFYFLKRFILSGNVLVNNKIINYSSYILVPGDIISVNKSYFQFIYGSIKSRLLSRRVLLNAPTFVEVDYKLLVAIVLRSPHSKDLTMPVSFNLYTSPLSFNR